MSIFICGPSKGKYSEPIPIEKAGITWVDDDYHTVNAPKKHRCEHPNHFNWSFGSKNGRKLIYKTSEMFYQKFVLTKEELKIAIDEYDIFSLDMSGRIICKNCAEKEIKKIYDK